MFKTAIILCCLVMTACACQQHQPRPKTLVVPTHDQKFKEYRAQGYAFNEALNMSQAYCFANACIYGK